MDCGSVHESLAPFLAAVNKAKNTRSEENKFFSSVVSNFLYVCFFFSPSGDETRTVRTPDYLRDRRYATVDWFTESLIYVIWFLIFGLVFVFPAWPVNFRPHAESSSWR